MFQGQATANPDWNRPIEQQHAYADWNPDVSGLQKFAGQAGGWGNKLLGQGQQMAGLYQNPSAWMSAFGMLPMDLRNPNTQGFVGAANKFQNANIMTPLQENLKRIQGAGIQRGGYGVSGGGWNPEGQLQNQAIGQVAGSAQQNLMNSMGWLDKQNQLGYGLSGQYGSAMQGILGAGAGMMGQQRGALGDILGAQERRQAGYAGEEAGNVARYNQMLSQLPQNAMGLRQQGQQFADDQFRRDQAAGGMAGLKSSLAQQTGKLGTAADWGWNTGMAPIWQQQAGISPGNFGAAPVRNRY